MSESNEKDNQEGQEKLVADGWVVADSAVPAETQVT